MDHINAQHLHQALPATEAQRNLSSLFSQASYMPHGHCYLWQSDLVWTHVLSDLVIGIAYVCISITLYALVRRMRLPFSTVVLCFGLFIGACGATHFMEIWTLWHADYWWSAWVKVITAVASAGTGFYLYRLRHPLVTVAEAAKLSEQRRLDLEVLTGSLEKRVAERTEALERTTRQLQLVTNALPVLIAYIDSSERYTFVNQTYESWFERPSSEILGKSVRDLAGNANYRNFAPHIQRALAGENVEYVSELRLPGGRKVAFRATYVPDFDAHGGVRGYVALIEDISERMRIEHELAQAVRMRDEFISVASHELKTPVTSLKLQTQLLERSMEKASGQADPERIRKVVGTSNRQLDRLVKLIDDMLDISRISTGRLTVDPEPLDLSELSREVCARYSLHAQEQGTSLSWSIAPGVSGVCDRVRIEQVIENLLSNAIKYGNGQPVVFSLEKQGGLAVISVRDRGIGIAEENLQRIFERFERATPSANISGLGLGLYIVREIIRLHHGTIHVSSQLGQGSEFTVKLPLQAMKAGA